MRRLALIPSLAFAVAACSGTGGGTGGTSSSTGGSSSGGSRGSGGSTGASSGSTGRGTGTGGTTGVSSGSSSGASSGGATGASSSSGGAGTSSGASSGGGPCSEPDGEVCALGSGYGFCCLGTCTDPMSDPMNCGQCYDQCQASQSCTQGNCTYPNCDGVPNGALCAGNAGSQDPSQRCVGGVCVATTCAGSNAPVECALSGDAGIGSCCEGQCSGFDDATNCGGCGIECPTGASCADGECSSSCADGGCPGGTVCAQSLYAGLACLSPSCAGAPDDQSCATVGGGGGVCCNGGCTDTWTDSQNCGQCYEACPSGELCVYGSCQGVVASCGNVPVGTLCAQADGGLGGCCGGCRQLDFQTDPANCGGCGQICPQGATCAGGQCVLADGGSGWCDLPGNACPAGDACVSTVCATQTCDASDAMEPCAGPGTAGGTAQCCGSACVDTNEDSANCGVCGNVCAAGMFCLSGQCTASPTCGRANSGTPCPLASAKNGTCCAGQCVDTGSDPANCQGCGVVCPVGQLCNQANAYAPCGLADGGPAPSCYDDGAACPAGTLCATQGCLSPACPPGASGLRCAFGSSIMGTCCDGVCTDTTQDPANCGSCGTACASGICYTTFGASTAQCLPAADGGNCASANGGFGCAPGTTCLAGSCVSSSGCNGPFGFCQAGDGNVGACCQDFLATTCADLATDPQNCGGCGEQCPSGQTCANGVCSGSVSPCLGGRRGAYCDLDAGPAFVCCLGGGCPDLETDSANCGYCGNACQTGLACLNGQCLATTCTSTTAGQTCEEGDGGLGGCCGNSCLDLGADRDNCGACGAKCASAETCVQGACVIPQCSPAYQGAPCDVDAGNGYLYVGSCCGTACVDTQGDPENCGLCGNACGDGGCSHGSCQ
ncbi:MAG TPA: hypothetical protein VMB50_19215 [Myxococcales bacterium]|nr:hypothetical protein [Myxococcales bacterium]